MKILELFAGSRSIGKAAEAAGHEVISCDIEQFGDIDIVGDILEIPISRYLEYDFDMVWASAPCTSFSIAGCSHHYRKVDNLFVPISEGAILGMQMLNITLEIIKQVNPSIWYIENPRGLMRKMPVMQGLPRTTVWYCKYGDNRAKPTDIWSNNISNLFNQDGWLPRGQCYNGNEKCHHEPAPRGSKTGTQGLKNNHERSKIPAQLCNEIINSLK